MCNLGHHAGTPHFERGEEGADLQVHYLALEVDGPLCFDFARAAGDGGEVNVGGAEELFVCVCERERESMFS